MSAAKTPKPDERVATKRMVLRRATVLEMPLEVEGKTVEETAAVLAKQLKRGTVEAWVVVGEFDGLSKLAAIEAHAGKPGAPDAKVGEFKAPPVGAWKGGARYAQPALPKVEREVLD